MIQESYPIMIKWMDFKPMVKSFKKGIVSLLFKIFTFFLYFSILSVFIPEYYKQKDKGLVLWLVKIFISNWAFYFFRWPMWSLSPKHNSMKLVLLSYSEFIEWYLIFDSKFLQLKRFYAFTESGFLDASTFFSNHLLKN